MLSSKLSNINAAVNDASSLDRLRAVAPAGFGLDDGASTGQQRLASFFRPGSAAAGAAAAPATEDPVECFDDETWEAPSELGLRTSGAPVAAAAGRAGVAAFSDVIEISDDEEGGGCGAASAPAGASESAGGEPSRSESLVDTNSGSRSGGPSAPKAVFVIDLVDSGSEPE